MYNIQGNIQTSLGNFTMEGRWFRYSSFVPRLYNWCQSLGFEAGNIIPSRAFCSDESQGYPVILMTKHFAAFPFNHGRVGGIMAVDRHGPHAHHGEDLLIVHASHVGYDPETKHFGMYRRGQTEHSTCSSNCGKIHGTLEWYLNEYEFAKNNIFIDMRGDQCCLTIDNKYLSSNHPQSLALHLDKMLEQGANGEIVPLSSQSTSRTFRASAEFYAVMREYFIDTDVVAPIGKALLPEFFIYHHSDLSEDTDGSRQLEANLIGVMPSIVTSDEPLLTAAQANTQAEFDRAYRSISQEPAYQGRNLLYITGLNIDISPEKGQLFPLTKFVPWAAYVQLKTGESYVVEQDDLFNLLNDLSEENENQISMDDAIHSMEDAEEVILHLPQI
ncbi:MAG: hypothetical protein KAH00_09025 [Cocleimonas sp.]|nr:hypothetical protein [Cocleimonas sp.]